MGLQDNFIQQMYKVDSENVYNVDTASFGPCLEMQCLSWHGNGVTSTLILPVESLWSANNLFLNF